MQGRKTMADEKATISSGSTDKASLQLRIMERANDLEIGAISPAEFATYLNDNEDAKGVFTLLLPTMLDANLFPISPNLGNAIKLVGDLGVLKFVQFTPPSQASATLLYALSERLIPSGVLRQMHRNVRYAASELNWSDYIATSVLFCGLKNPHAFSHQEQQSAVTRSPIPSEDIESFSEWLAYLKELCESTFLILSGLATPIPTEPPNTISTKVMENLRKMQNTFKEVQVTQFGSSHQASRAGLHKTLFLLTQLARRNIKDMKKSDWDTTAIAFAILYKHLPSTEDQAAWWSSVVTVIETHGSSDTAKHLCLFPFLAFDSSRYVPDDALVHLLRVLCTSKHNCIVFVLLLLSRTILKDLTDGMARYRVVGSCLPLPEGIFKCVISFMNEK